MKHIKETIEVNIAMHITDNYIYYWKKQYILF